MRSLGATFCMIAGIFISNSCSKQEPIKVDNTIAVTPVSNVTGACNCATTKPSCPPDRIQCFENLLGTENTSRTFTLYWESCSSPGGAGFVSETSTVKVCYYSGLNECSLINFQISDPPSYLPCLPNPFCMTLRVKCNSDGSWTFSDIYQDPFSLSSVTTTITNDPSVVMTCTDDYGNSYNCVGHINL